jgi:hypothetical protein
MVEISWKNEGNPTLNQRRSVASPVEPVGRMAEPIERKEDAGQKPGEIGGRIRRNLMERRAELNRKADGNQSGKQ